MFCCPLVRFASINIDKAWVSVSSRLCGMFSCLAALLYIELGCGEAFVGHKSLKTFEASTYSFVWHMKAYRRALNTETFNFLTLSFTDMFNFFLSCRSNLLPGEQSPSICRLVILDETLLVKNSSENRNTY